MKILHDGQCGFKKKLSCLEQLIYITEKMRLAMQNRKITGIILDISKTFDRVWVKGFLHKLYTKYKIRGDMFLLLNNYFQECKLCV